MRQETAFFDRTRTGELINRLSADTILVGKAVTDNVSDGLRAVAQSVAGVSMMVSLIVKVTLPDACSTAPANFFLWFICKEVENRT